MKIFYNGKEITPAVSVNGCVHDMYAADNSDTLYLRFNNARQLWDIWRPQAGDTIAVEEGAARTGKMYVHSLYPENTAYSMIAASSPPSALDPEDRAWEQVRLHQIIKDIATKHDLDYQIIGLEDFLYSYILQSKTSDLEFLNYRLSLESAAMIVFNGILVAYSEPAMEQIKPTAAVTIAASQNFQFIDTTGQQYGTVQINAGKYSGSFSAPQTASSRILRLSAEAGSEIEANRFAMGLLRHANRYGRKGSIQNGFYPGLAAGSTITLQTESEPSWNGPSFLYRVRNEYVSKSTKLYFRKGLEGY